jgi:hypothetical protein
MLVTGVSRVVAIGLLMVGATAGLTGEWHANAHSGQAAESKAVCAGEMTRLVESTRWKCSAATICANASASAISSTVALRRRFPLPVDGLEVVTGLAPAPSERFTSNGANPH